MIKFNIKFIALNNTAAFIVFGISIHAQKTYEIDASHLTAATPVAINMQATNPQGVKLSANNQYFEKDGKPWFPLMGEMHYNRVPPQDWEEGILKMKNAGLSIIATYIFWKEHEPEKGVWDWKGNCDLKQFIQLCAKHNVYVWLRIGPWSHGEQLNGGFPGWVQHMQGTRRNTPEYLDSATTLYNEIGKQTHGLFFRDGGPIVRLSMPDKKVVVQVRLKNETIRFPELTLKGQKTLILPFNLKINDVTIKYATAQPLAKINNGNATTLFMMKPEDVNSSVSVEVKKDSLVAGSLKLNEPFVVKGTIGKKLIIILLSRKDAENSWGATINGKQAMIITSADVIADDRSIQLHQMNNASFNIKVYPANVAAFSFSNKKLIAKKYAWCDEYSLAVNKVVVDAKTTIKNKTATVTLPSALPKNTSNMFLKINYPGGLCTCKQDGKLLTDNLFNGTSWLPGTKNFLNKTALQFSIQDWTDNITGVDRKLVNKIKTGGSRFISIEALPQYKLNIGF
ncbi:beta-galactosidase [Parafilimonas sp.]|uniref:beta-galactosidase n=1 Tax=Parafilimonas sp. TaxID=1969739 RepID=UPI0039E38A9E